MRALKALACRARAIPASLHASPCLATLAAMPDFFALACAPSMSHEENTCHQRYSVQIPDCQKQGHPYRSLHQRLRCWGQAQCIHSAQLSNRAWIVVAPSNQRSATRTKHALILGQSRKCSHFYSNRGALAGLHHYPISYSLLKTVPMSRAVLEPRSRWKHE